ncbi:Basic-leucine zipper (bZIP) transcription factor family protein [Rhynchospora pubera]|uniref:Basic-leucine zipper (BZIP) transcription factor family protein n=1 Tax=Rhynchospora pubera TaxID=906938 RepID=A0AAV8GSH8_9POAL|nr:Basic-leucine zipper (bZIP) transcription factor family protein [Rhynchospora pubera]KAJ4776509.1 Basic-leucine zipper (bZIP) transcription factor family protein [Rhynchospora pubera]KAJ4806292.1 Basic-leucine zipper (bZIP) transcription factor family protein [Rhynchospora pubera]
MDEGDIDFSNPDAFGGPQVSIEDPPSSCSMDSFFDEILKDNTQQHACTHTHTCNPPGRDLSHTHTCFHVHTKILSAPTEQTSDSAEKTPNSSTSKKRPCGNREAVRKYREKKKAHTASLEDEVVQLRALNQQLLKRLQGQAALEAEVARLRCLLVDIRGRIEGEIGTFPYKKPEMGSGGVLVNTCDFRCDDQMYCPKQGMQGNGNGGVNNLQGFGVCEAANIQCMGDGLSGNPGAGTISDSRKFVACGGEGVNPYGCLPNAEQK